MRWQKPWESSRRSDGLRDGENHGGSSRRDIRDHGVHLDVMLLDHERQIELLSFK